MCAYTTNFAYMINQQYLHDQIQPNIGSDAHQQVADEKGDVLISVYRVEVFLKNTETYDRDGESISAI
eukprot:scaffold44783_cov61-Cyclotella_meneghiniana.AAC.1